jgi:hypothetical protein
MKSDILIKDDIYGVLKDSALASAVTGKVCKQGVRPKGSKLEDVVISVVANMNGQIQDAIVNVNIYVADDQKKDGSFQESTIRLRELCSLAYKTLDKRYGDGYRFYIESQRVLEVADTHEHVINNRIIYKYLNE